jgi:ketosteroid isomerase-like protein
MFQQQMQLLDAPPEIENHDIVAGDDHTVVLNKARASRGGKMLEQNQVVVMHIEGGKIADVLLHFFGSAGHGRVRLRPKAARLLNRSPASI